MTASSFSWLDHSEAQRRQMLEIVDLFREKGTLDELGFGSIRDAFSDHLFPGTSTLYTRARYLLFVPWIYLRIERDHLPYPQVDARARSDQAGLARALQSGGEGDAQGVIGIQAGEALQRTPAAIYWTGLKRYRIWQFPGSLTQYWAAIRRRGRRPRWRARTTANWSSERRDHPHLLPEYDPSDFARSDSSGRPGVAPDHGSKAHRFPARTGPRRRRFGLARSAG